MLADFEYLNLAHILNTSSLEYLLTIKEPVHPEFVHYFCSNLNFQDNYIRYRVLVEILTSFYKNLSIYYAPPVRV